jgi:hypothetical protein
MANNRVFIVIGRNQLFVSILNITLTDADRSSGQVSVLEPK